MVKSYVLIESKTGSIQSLVEDVNDIGEVSEASAVTGKYDVIAEFEVEKTEQILDLVSGQIQKLPGVDDTVTCIST